VRSEDVLNAMERITSDAENDEDMGLLLAPGSSLGGARPKASIRDKDGHLAIAKFSHQDDGISQVMWEALALILAKKAGIKVPDLRLEFVASKPVLLLRRFDRTGSMRIPFLSAMSMLGANDGEQHSYLEIADAIRQHGGSPQEDLRALWKRILYSILISNTDDHLRNHGFLYEGPSGWRLSPAYDLNPVPTDIKPRILTTAINEEDATASIDLVLKVSSYFELKLDEAKAMAAKVAHTVADWRSEALGLGIPVKEINRMSSAFEHRDLQDALKLG
jgi:serine/threonine-protein kinase HipA